MAKFLGGINVVTVAADLVPELKLDAMAIEEPPSFGGGRRLGQDGLLLAPTGSLSDVERGLIPECADASSHASRQRATSPCGS